MNKLSEIRVLMAERDLDAYIVTNNDPHGAERTTGHWNARAWVSGFTGSSGTLIIMKDMAGLWTDGRYHIQAANELRDSGIDLFKYGIPDVPTHTKYLSDKLPKDGRLGFNGQTFIASSFSGLKKELESKSISYHYKDDLVDMIWNDRPNLSQNKAFLHEPPFATTPASKKIETVRTKMEEKNYDYYLVSGLDAVAWLLNIRGYDMPNVPMIYGHVFVTATETHFFVDQAKLEGIEDRLINEGVTLHAYESLPEFLGGLSEGKIYYNSASTNVLLSEAIPPGLDFDNKPEQDITSPLKAVKSEADIANIRNAFIKEGAVMVKAMKWIDENVANGNLHESDVVNVLTDLRKKQKDYVMDAFSTICAYGENAAQAHYSSGIKGSPIKPEGFLLIDTGGNYLDGTTDTTRTISVGSLTEQMRTDFTLVLKGHIALSNAVFLKGTTGPAIDILARHPIWQSGQNFSHGTGHGIGYFLSVHEGPHSISISKNAVALEPGMLISNEPGIYKEGQYGIRTECIIHVMPYLTTPDGEFYAFENLTICPIDIKALNKDLLTADEITWINDYHKKIRETLTPYLTIDELMWLKRATEEI